MSKRQLDLFGPEPVQEPDPLDFSEDAELAARVPPHVRFGTSSWTFSGWGGIVYPRGVSDAVLQARGLELYARCPLLRTVGIDRSYYRPLESPELQRYAAQLPSDFRCVMKVWSDVTSRVDHATRALNPHFLSASVFTDAVLGPVSESFAAHAGPFVFELAPLRGPELPRRGELPDLLSRFFEALPRGPRYAVELRNRELFTPAYLRALRAYNVAHVLNYWERMPPIGEQLDVPGIFSADFVVARLLIPPGERYAEKKAEFAPFDRIVTPQPALHEDMARLVAAAGLHRVELFVIVNNKVEGSSPLTIRTIARRVASPSF
ncbi:MAG TPA: DUF72 domain-containing protein [Polyangiaceae bacterium]|nr:DUF72 domain-containing protein [Polyangiaceae bacterium]